MKLEFKNLEAGVMFLHPNGKTYRKAGRSLKANNDGGARSHTNLQLMVTPLYNVPVQCYHRRSKLTIKYINEHGVANRLDGPAIETSDGTTEWYINGKRHRDDGPAVENANGYKEWWVNGKLHRLDGPAYIDKYNDSAYYINGIRYYDNFEFQVAAELIKQQQLTT